MRETKINFVKKSDTGSNQSHKKKNNFKSEESKQKKSIGIKVARLMDKENLTMEEAIAKIMSFNNRQSKKFNDKPRFGDKKPRFDKKSEDFNNAEKRQDSRFSDKPRRSFDEKKKLNVGNRNHNRDNQMLSELQRKIEILKNAGMLEKSDKPE